MRALGYSCVLGIIGNYIACVHTANIKKKSKYLKNRRSNYNCYYKTHAPLTGRDLCNTIIFKISTHAPFWGATQMPFSRFIITQRYRRVNRISAHFKRGIEYKIRQVRDFLNYTLAASLRNIPPCSRNRPYCGEDCDIRDAHNNELRVAAAFGDFLRRVRVHSVGHQRIGPYMT